MTPANMRSEDSLAVATFGGVSHRRLKGREVQVMEYAECVDLGDAPEIFISGISKAEQIGPGTIRFTFYSERDNCRRVILHTIWDIRKWIDDFTQIEDLRGSLRYGPNRLDHVRAS